MRNNSERHYLASVEARNEVSALFDCKNIQHMEKAELFKLQQQLQLGDTWGVISVPEDWLAPGGTKAARTVNLHVACDGATTAVEVERALLALSRFAVLLFVLPVFGQRSRTLLSASTLLAYLRQLSVLVRIAHRRPTDKSNQFFSRLCADDLTGLIGAKEKAVVLDHMVSYGKHGYWSDIPRLGNDDIDEVSRSANARYGRKKRPERQWMPLPDKFVAAAGWRFIWITKTLGPAVLECVEGLIAAYRKSLPKDEIDKGSIRSLRTGVAKEYLSSYRWVGVDGKVLSRLPFQLHLTTTGKRKGNFEWPPRYLGEMKDLLRILQASHLFLFLLCTGARASEALGLEPNSVLKKSGKNVIVKGATFKPSFSDEGRNHDWPLPSTAVFALEQQARLADAIDNLKPWSAQKDGLGSRSLFVSVLTGEELKNTYNTQLRKAIKSLRLDSEMDEHGLHAHRFRKTLARLGALAIIGAPKIFMDLFGHENVGATLNYMLTDPLLHAEMQEVRKAEVIMMAEKAIETAENNGGLAAAKIRDAVRAEQVRRGTQFGKEDIRGLAEMLTMGGEIWQYVRPGVICTKTHLQSGPCHIRVARPEPSRCKSQCEHRLEEAALRDDVNRAIGDAVQFYKQDTAEGKLFQAEMWEGQILHNLSRFPDLAVKWGANEVVAMMVVKNKGA